MLKEEEEEEGVEILDDVPVEYPVAINDEPEKGEN